MKGRELIQYTRERFTAMVGVSSEERKEIRNDIIVKNMALVSHILKKYSPYTMDTYQDGCIGLIKAAEAYSIEKHVPFANFACLCIEREIQLVHKNRGRRFEKFHEYDIDSLQDMVVMGNGDAVSRESLIPDLASEEAFEHALADFDLENLFICAIIPTIEDMCSRTSTLDLDLWAKLEMQYIMELSKDVADRGKLTFTAMAEELGTTPQNIRGRHNKAMNLIRNKCIEEGIYLDSIC